MTTEGRTVIVTGASQGIGAGIVRGFLARGYAVCWNDERTKAIRDAADVATGDTIHVTLSRGAIAAKVSGIE